MEWFLKTFRKIQCVSRVDTFNDPRNLLNSLGSTKYDIIFLDICLPHINGIETAKKIRNVDSDVNIVFITGANKFGLEAFSIYATDYILKPLNYERLERTVKRIKTKLRLDNDKIVDIKTQNVVYRVKESDVVLIEKVMNRCMVYTKKFTFDVLSPIKHFENILDENKFIRSHSGYLVNRDEISRIEVNGNLSYTLHFFDLEKTALLSRGKKDKLFDCILNTKVQNGG
jgi:DNA-binding LytR/AlgR family response regulator